MRTTTERAALALVALVSLAPAAAQAHAPSSPLAVALDLERTRVAAYVRYTVERGPEARALREQFDADADGRFDDAERGRLRDFLAARARGAVRVAVGGQPLALETRSIGEELEGSAAGDERLAVALRLVGPVTWPSGTSRLAVDVELPDARAMTPVAVRVAASAAAALALDPDAPAAGIASRGEPLERRVTSHGPPRRRR